MSGKESCCCGLIALRNGLISIAIIGVILGVVFWSTGIFFFANNYIFVRWLHGLVVALGIIFLLLELATWISLIFGTLLNSRKFILGTLVGIVIAIGLRIVICVVMFIPRISPVIPVVGIPFAIAILLVVALYLYWFFVIYKFFRTSNHE